MDKNHKMWDDLSMDLDKHDLLCEVLPQAFGDVFLSQENRPEKMDYFNAVTADIHGVRPAELIEAQKKWTKSYRKFLYPCSRRSCLGSKWNFYRTLLRLTILGSRWREKIANSNLPFDKSITWCKI